MSHDGACAAPHPGLFLTALDTNEVTPLDTEARANAGPPPWSFSIGSGGDNDVILEDSSVAPRHATILLTRLADGKFRIKLEALTASDRTQVNKIICSPGNKYQITAGSTFFIGNVRCQVDIQEAGESGGEAACAPLPRGAGVDVATGDPGSMHTPASRSAAAAGASFDECLNAVSDEGHQPQEPPPPQQQAVAAAAAASEQQEWSQDGGGDAAHGGGGGEDDDPFEPGMTQTMQGATQLDPSQAALLYGGGGGGGGAGASLDDGMDDNLTEDDESWARRAEDEEEHGDEYGDELGRDEGRDELGDSEEEAERQPPPPEQPAATTAADAAAAAAAAAVRAALCQRHRG
jgi:hypothetical protein